MPCVTRYLKGFVDYLRDERKHSALTVEGYAGDVRRALAWLEKELERPPQISDLTLSSLRSYQASRGKEQSTSIIRKISALKSFCGYLHREGHLSEDPTEKLICPRRQIAEPAILTQEDAKRLVLAPIEGTRSSKRGDAWFDEVLRLRDAAMLEVLYADLLRISEVSGLLMKDVSFRKITKGRDKGKDQMALHVMGKGGKRCYVYARGAPVERMRAYLARRQELNPRTDAVFVSFRGQALSAGSARSVVYRWAEVCGLQVHPHMLRHTGVTHLLEEGAKPHLVQRQARHASLQTTTTYTHVVGVDLGEEVAAKHPRAQREQPAEPDPIVLLSNKVEYLTRIIEDLVARKAA
jgi:site-specific recombinase XerD